MSKGTKSVVAPTPVVPEPGNRAQQSGDPPLAVLR